MGDELLVDAGQLSADALLLGAIKLGGDEAVEVAFKELFLPSSESVSLGPELALRCSSLGRLDVQVVLERHLDLRSILFGELQTFVEADNLVFDRAHGERTLLAVIAAFMSTGAEQVFVGRSGAVRCLVHDEPALAAAAEDGALQVERVLTCLLAGYSQRKSILDLLPQRLTDERRMST